MEQLSEEPLEPLDQSILDILEDDWRPDSGFNVQGIVPRACHVLADQQGVEDNPECERDGIITRSCYLKLRN